MKPELTIEHLSPYLPYRLGILLNDNVYTLTGLDNPCKTVEKHFLKCELRPKDKGYIEIHSHVFNRVENDAKPIFRPLSELTKEITVNGETFTPILKLANHIPDFATVLSVGYSHHKYYAALVWNNGVNDDFLRKEISAYYLDMQYYDFQKLVSWHFDVFGLIEKDLAIDINTLKLS